MKILKQRITRIIALIAACVLVAVCAFSVTKALLNYDKLLGGEKDYMSGYGFSEEVNDLYKQLWFVGNMYLRNLDEDGNFKGTPELKASTESVMKELGLMDDNGNISIDASGGLEYYVSYGDSRLSSTDKSYDEIYNGEYSFVVENGKISEIPDNLHWWNDNFHWYSTNYGMYYYYCDGQGAAVFDYDTSGLDYYVDESGARIYYKTDGTTPIPIADDYSYYNGYYDENGEWIDVQEETIPKEELEQAGSNGYLLYNVDEGKWIHVDNNSFVNLPGNETRLTICITPNSFVIQMYEQARLEYSSEMSSFVKLLVDFIPVAVIVLILTVYALIAGGYSVSEGNFVLRGFDRVFAEFPIICIIAAVLGGGSLISPDVISVVIDFFNTFYNSENLMPVVYGIAYTLVFAVIVGMLNTIFVRIKCRSFWKTTLVGRIFGWLLTHIKKLRKKIRFGIVSKEMLRNDICTRRFIVRLSVFVILEIILIALCIDWNTFGAMLSCSVLLLLLYVFLSFRDLKALKALGEQISAMNGGDYSRREVPEDSVTYGMTEKLNNISDGIQTAVDRQIQSERMKIDLVTNVSHDLKTPLTSIISYINLLSMEELTPEAADYVKILEQKSERLRAIVSDLFDLAKATSRTDVQLEMIDAVILIGQVLGDMSDKIGSYGKEIRTEILMESAPIYAEGKKLYRVLQNLIDNALKYSLDGTRIYLILREEDGKAVILLKNISSYEMTFTPDEITERFTRGDESRTSEGNGLGLSIAKSFTEACGGEFRVIVDGDVFAAEIKLPLITKKDDNINE